MRQRTRLLWLFTLAMSQAAAAIEMERVQFPGFSMLLPKGGVVEHTSTVPFGGSHRVKLPETGWVDRLNPMDKKRPRPEYNVNWNLGDLTHQESVDLNRGNLLNVLPIPNSRVLREKDLSPNTWIALIGNPSAFMGIAEVTCEPGFDVSVILASSSDLTEQWEDLRRIAESVKCALTDANRRAAEASVRLPRGFSRFRGEATPTYATLDGEQLVVGFTPTNMMEKRDILPRILSSLFGQAMNIPPEKISTVLVSVDEKHVPPEALLRLQFPGSAVPMYVGTKWCPKVGLTYMAIYTATTVSIARMHVIMNSVDCPGAPTEAVPDAGPIFKVACDAQNETACGLLQTYKP